MILAQNGRRNSSDIPVSKKKNTVEPTTRRYTDSYRYEDLLRRENGQASARKPQQSQNDIYFNKNKPESPQRKKSYDDYLNDFSTSSGDIRISKKNTPPAAEYSKGGERKNSSRPKKKKGGFFKGVLSVVLVLAVVYLGVTGYIYTIFSNTDYKKTDASASSVSSVALKSDSSVKNILLIGVDDKKGGSTSRSDTMILVSIDKKNKQLKMTSFMRDTYVTIPGYGQDRMNAACTYGGPQLVMETIEYNFGIDIDNYVLVDFNAFKDVIDGIGGVTVEVEQREAEYINRTSKQNIEYGEAVTLNGEEALVYVRIRYLDSDFYRTQRQRKVISAILGKMKKTNPFELIETGKKVLSYIETDLNPLELTLLSQGAVLSYMRYDIVQSRVPFDNKYTSATINGASVLTVDMQETGELIRDFIYTKAEISEEE